MSQCLASSTRPHPSLHFTIIFHSTRAGRSHSRSRLCVLCVACVCVCPVTSQSANYGWHLKYLNVRCVAMITVIPATAKIDQSLCKWQFSCATNTEKGDRPGRDAPDAWKTNSNKWEGVKELICVCAKADHRRLLAVCIFHITVISFCVLFSFRTGCSSDFGGAGD